MQINELLKLMVNQNASDLHIRVGSPPIFRIFGKLVIVKDWQVVTIEDAQTVYDMITNPTHRQIFRGNAGIRFSVQCVRHRKVPC